MNSQLIIRPLEAKLIHNTDLFMKMDPYCKFKIGKEKVKSKVHKKGGKTPVWTDTLTLKREIGDDILKVEVKDKDTFTRDDVVGKGILNLHDIPSFIPISKWVPLFYKEKHAGDVLVEVTITNDYSLTGGSSAQKVSLYTETVTKTTTTTTTYQPVTATYTKTTVSYTVGGQPGGAYKCGNEFKALPPMVCEGKSKGKAGKGCH